MILDIARLLFFPALMAFAAASDMFTMKISNRLSIALVAGFVVLAFADGMAAMTILGHVGAAALVLLVTVFCFSRGWMGGGDAKMASAVALWFGFEHLLEFLLWASLLGGVLTLLLLQFRRWPLPLMLTGRAWVERLHRKGGGVPYGIALAASALLIYGDTGWVRSVGPALNLLR
ncbi:MAG: prepilin peptidase [Alphaproteobacteria bacterium]|nr:prepilin peptidase [Alphaproteobacteria bacterium]